MDTFYLGLTIVIDTLYILYCGAYCGPGDVASICLYVNQSLNGPRKGRPLLKDWRRGKTLSPQIHWLSQGTHLHETSLSRFLVLPLIYLGSRSPTLRVLIFCTVVCESADVAEQNPKYFGRWNGSHLLIKAVYSAACPKFSIQKETNSTVWKIFYNHTTGESEFYSDW